MNCPSCKTEFIEKRDTAYNCKNCGWLMEVDGKWITCPEPAKQKEPEKIPEPKPAEPKAGIQPEPLQDVFHTQKDWKFKSYLGGLITITEIEDK
jgi:hypothetical protein